MKEAGLARGLFWEQLLRSNGLVRATLTFPSGRRAGLERGGAAAGRATAPHAHGVEEKGASGLQAFSLVGAGTVTEGNFPSSKWTGDPSTRPFPCAS